MTERPNLLVIMSDQHAARWCGCYGQATVKTPNIDALARNSVVFDSAYCHSPLCVPSRMSFMTGRRIQDIGVWDNNTTLSSDTRTWAHAVRSAGYDAVLCGKMHFAGADRLHGFRAQLAADPAGDDEHSMPVPDWKRGRVSDISVTDIRALMKAEPGTSFATDVDDLAVEQACGYLSSPEGRDQPWALMVGLYLPHPPLTVEQEYLALYDDESIDLPVIPSGHLDRQHPVHRRSRSMKRSPDRFADADIRAVRRAYYACASRVDHCVGRVLDALRSSGQEDRTVVVYTSDHGEMLGEHGLWTKSSFYEESASVPLVIRMPEAPAARVRQPVSLLDLSATIVDFAGADLPGCAGESLRPLIEPASSRAADHTAGGGRRPSVFGEYYGTWVDRPLAMIRGERYKLVQSLNEPPELYDLERDPHETHDLGTNTGHERIRAELQQTLFEQWDPQRLYDRVIASQQERLG